MESIKSPATSAPKPAKPDLDEVIVVEAVLESGHGVKFQEKAGVVFVTSISSGSHACTVPVLTSTVNVVIMSWPQLQAASSTKGQPGCEEHINFQRYEIKDRKEGLQQVCIKLQT